MSVEVIRQVMAILSRLARTRTTVLAVQAIGAYPTVAMAPRMVDALCKLP